MYTRSRTILHLSDSLSITPTPTPTPPFGFCLSYPNDGHAGDGAVRVVLRRAVDRVVGAHHQAHVCGAHLIVDFLCSFSASHNRNAQKKTHRKIAADREEERGHCKSSCAQVPMQLTRSPNQHSPFGEFTWHILDETIESSIFTEASTEVSVLEPFVVIQRMRAKASSLSPACPTPAFNQYIIKRGRLVLPSSFEARRTKKDESKARSNGNDDGSSKSPTICRQHTLSPKQHDRAEFSTCFLHTSISCTMSYGTPASASNTLSCPGIRPATGCTANLTCTPEYVSCIT